MPGSRLSRKKSSAVELRDAYMRPLQGVSLLGEDNLFKSAQNAPVPLQGRLR